MGSEAPKIQAPSKSLGLSCDLVKQPRSLCRTELATHDPRIDVAIIYIYICNIYFLSLVVYVLYTIYVYRY